MNPATWGSAEQVRLWARSGVGEAFVRDLERERDEALTRILADAKNATDLAKIRSSWARFDALTSVLEVLTAARSVEDAKRG